MCTRVQGGAGTGRCGQAWGTLGTLANLEMCLEQSSANTVVDVIKIKKHPQRMNLLIIAFSVC